MSKGSHRRPMRITQEEWVRRFEEVFGHKDDWWFNNLEPGEATLIKSEILARRKRCEDNAQDAERSTTASD